MTKSHRTILAALALFLSPLLAIFIGATTPVSALGATATQTITINATAAAWEDNINLYILSSDVPLRYIISNAIGDIAAIYVDGELLDTSNYDVQDVNPGLLYLTIILSPTYLKTLGLGEHSMDVVFTDTTVFSDVFFVDTRLRLEPPSTGFFGGGLREIISSPLALGTLGIIGLGLIAFIITRSTRIHPNSQFTGISIKKHKGLAVVTVLVVAAGIYGGIAAILHNPTPAAAAPDTSTTMSITPDHLQYNLLVGGMATMNFSSLVTAPIFAGSYTITAVSDNINPDIALNISSANLTTPTPLPATPATPLTIRNYAGSPYDGHTSNYTLAVTLDQDIPVGTYTIAITYELDTDDQEYFMFTIDTRMTDTIDTDPTHYDGTATTFSIPTSGQVNGYESEHPYSWLIDWGDNTTQAVTGLSSSNSPGIPHTYATPGEYQIAIASNGPATNGWMNAFGFYWWDWDISDANTQENKDMFKSIDTPFANNMRTPGSTDRFSHMFVEARNATTIPANLFSQISTTGDTDFSNMFYSIFYHYAYNSTTAFIPAGLFSTIDTSSATNLSYAFADAFQSYAYESTTASIPAGLFSSLDTSAATDFSSMFEGIFNRYAHESTTASIPADLFSSIDTSNAVDSSRMFNTTFNAYARNSTTASIPAGLFDSIDTSNATDVSGMFSSTFAYFAYYSTTASIPAGLFDSINTSNAKDALYMFSDTFNSYAYYSTTASIPSGLFDSIDTSAATELSYMFSATFQFYAYESTVGTIPAGLFNAIDTSNATDLASMFHTTFSAYAYNSTVGTIPAGLFDSINTSNATNMPYTFYSTFGSYARSSTVGTIPAGLFDSIDTSSITSLPNTFMSTFGSYARNSTTASIPAGLFDSITTSHLTTLYHTFYTTFAGYAYYSTSATIPTGFFDFVDLSSATNVTGLFGSTFHSYAYARTSIGTDINDVWGNANFAGKVTAANVAGFSGVLDKTFYGMRSLGGIAQTFIDTKLGSITPASSAQTFYGTTVSDLSSLHANWK